MPAFHSLVCGTPEVNSAGKDAQVVNVTHRHVVFKMPSLDLAEHVARGIWVELLSRCQASPSLCSLFLSTCGCIKGLLCLWPPVQFGHGETLSEDQSEKSESGCGAGLLDPSLRLWPAVPPMESHGPSLGSCLDVGFQMLSTAPCPFSRLRPETVWSLQHA